jgi:hypothetical protein
MVPFSFIFLVLIFIQIFPCASYAPATSVSALAIGGWAGHLSHSSQ